MIWIHGRRAGRVWIRGAGAGGQERDPGSHGGLGVVIGPMKMSPDMHVQDADGLQRKSLCRHVVGVAATVAVWKSVLAPGLVQVLPWTASWKQAPERRGDGDGGGAHESRRGLRDGPSGMISPQV